MSSPPLLAFAPPRSDVLPLEVKRLNGKNTEFALDTHGHRFYELVYIVKGKGWHRVGLEQSSVGPGDLLLVAPGEVHDSRGLIGIHGFLVLFESAVLEPRRPQPINLPGELAFLSFVRGAQAPASVTVPRAERAGWVFRCQSLYTEYTEKNLGREAVARAELEALLIRAARLVAPRLGLGSAHRPLLSRVFQFIEARYQRPISLVDVARSVGLSPAHLTTVVRRATGRSVLQWINERRMAEARRMLLETEKDVAAIGAEVGFVEPSYFVRRFHAMNRVTPLQFRLRAGQRPAPAQKKYHF
jgi:AraC family transcriptional regulator, transcriptional activator of pobA